MARIDKTESAVGVVRADNATAIDAADFGKLFGVGLNGSGRVVKGAGQSGIIGVVHFDRRSSRVGAPVDIFKLGDFVDCEGLAAGTKYYADAATGVISTTNTGTYVGFTVEATRLVLAI